MDETRNESDTAFLIRIALEHPTDSPDYKRLIHITDHLLALKELEFTMRREEDKS